MFKSEKVRVGDTKKGKAIFATQEINKDELIFGFGGEILNVADKYSIQIDDNKHLSGSGDINDLLNHSCNPTGYFDFDTLDFKAINDIEEGGEVTFNYLTSEWEMAVPFDCKCESSNCFEIIKGFKFCTPDQKKGMEEFLSPFIKKKLFTESS